MFKPGIIQYMKRYQPGFIIFTIGRGIIINWVNWPSDRTICTSCVCWTSPRKATTLGALNSLKGA